jgi:retinol dehydrogenase-12
MGVGPWLIDINSQSVSQPYVFLINDTLTLIVVLNVFFVRALNDRLLKTSNGVIVNCVNPGFCYSELRRGFTGIIAVVDWIMERLLAHTSEEGSRQLVWGAVGGADNGEDLRGEYISRSEVREVSDLILEKDGVVAQNDIWVGLFFEVTRLDLILGYIPRMRW